MSGSTYKLPQPDGSFVNVRDVQLASLNVLEVFHDFCSDRGLQYSLCGGCCIGSLRDGKFIPWDDDVDVHMPRPDYEKLARIWNSSEISSRYRLCRTDENNFYDTMLTAIVDTETTFIKKGQENLDIPHGVRLEIIPLDGAPNNALARKLQLFWSLIFYLYNRGFAPVHRGKLAAKLGDFMLRVVRSKKNRAKIWKFAEKQMSKYPFHESDFVTELTVTWRYMKNLYPRDIFKETRPGDFEGIKFNLPIEAEKYLRIAFGDYMELPPEEKRKPPHSAIFIDLDNSYLEYKGIYYPVKRDS